jgi:hypothetical protein
MSNSELTKRSMDTEGFAGFHLRHPGLAGLEALSQLNL